MEMEMEVSGREEGRKKEGRGCVFLLERVGAD